MAVERADERSEWVAHRTESWVETYKKAMLTPVILALVAEHQPTTVAHLTEHITAATGWHLTERGLYRTIKRLQDSGLLESTEMDAPRTGAKRKAISLCAPGADLLAGITSHLVTLPR